MSVSVVWDRKGGVRLQAHKRQTIPVELSRVSGKQHQQLTSSYPMIHVGKLPDWSVHNHNSDQDGEMMSFRSLLTTRAYKMHSITVVLDSHRVSVSEHNIPHGDSLSAVCQCPESLLSLLHDGLKPRDEAAEREVGTWKKNGGIGKKDTRKIRMDREMKYVCVCVAKGAQRVKHMDTSKNHGGETDGASVFVSFCFHCWKKKKRSSAKPPANFTFPFLSSLLTFFHISPPPG